MPIYEFICKSCGSQFDKLTSFEWKKAGIVCPQCSSDALDRAVSRIGGFFSTSGSSGGDSAPKMNTGSSACAHCPSSNCSTCH